MLAVPAQAQWTHHDGTVVPDYIGSGLPGTIISQNTSWTQPTTVPFVHVRNGATLTISTTVNVDTIYVTNGELVLAPGARVIVNHTAREIDVKDVGGGIITVADGGLRITGTARPRVFTLAADVLKDATSVTLPIGHGLQAGDTIVFPMTDFFRNGTLVYLADHRDEVRVLTGVSATTATWSTPLARSHMRPRLPNGSAACSLPIGLLTADVKIESLTPATIASRGHVMLMGKGRTELRNGAFINLGRSLIDGNQKTPPFTGIVTPGRYSIHLHHRMHGPEPVVEGNAIWGDDRTASGIVYHHSFYSKILNNFVYGTLGAAILDEDGNSAGSRVEGNLVIRVSGLGGGYFQGVPATIRHVAQYRAGGHGIVVAGYRQTVQNNWVCVGAAKTDQAGLMVFPLLAEPGLMPNSPDQDHNLWTSQNPQYGINITVQDNTVIGGAIGYIGWGINGTRTTTLPGVNRTTIGPNKAYDVASRGLHMYACSRVDWIQDTIVTGHRQPIDKVVHPATGVTLTNDERIWDCTYTGAIHGVGVGLELSPTINTFGMHGSVVAKLALRWGYPATLQGAADLPRTFPARTIEWTANMNGSHEFVRSINRDGEERIRDAVTPDALYITRNGTRYRAWAPDQAPTALAPITGVYPNNIGVRGNTSAYTGKTNAQVPLPSRGAVAPTVGLSWSNLLLTDAAVAPPPPVVPNPPPPPTAWSEYDRVTASMAQLIDDMKRLEAERAAIVTRIRQ
jgi:hypothetical protein